MVVAKAVQQFSPSNAPYFAPYFAPYAPALARYGPLRADRRWIDAFNAESAPQVLLKVGDTPFKALEYEREIYASGAIPTRIDSWHDLMNALVWAKFPMSKRALNVRHVNAPDDGVARCRVRDGLTLIDESGIILISEDHSLFEAHQCRDWHTLFITRRQAWLDGTITAILFGHGLMAALIEQPHAALTAKAVWFNDSLPAAQIDDALRARIDAALRARIDAADACLPKQLLPIPIFGIPGWNATNIAPAFYENARIFRPLSTIQI